jgi:FkbM family methyltransferase
MEDVTVDARGQKITMRTDNKITRWRLRELTSKERETLDWIDGFDKNSVFFDVGANVGSYSIYAAMRGHSVFAFEPSQPNRVRFYENVTLNDLGGQIKLFSYALADFDGEDTLYMGRKAGGGAGAAEHSIGKRLVRNGMDALYGSEQKKTPVRRLDTFCYGIGIWPRYMKIDTDGAEPRIVEGGRETMSRCLSMVIEQDDRIVENRGLPEVICGFGFKMTLDRRKKSGRWIGHGNVHYQKI